MNLGARVLLVLKVAWRLYKAIEADRPEYGRAPDRQPFIDELGQECDIENARWRDLPQD